MNEQVLTGTTPSLTPDEARALLRTHWGIADAAIGPLDSERDQNFRVDAGSGRYVLKVANRAEPVDVTRLQTRAIQHVAATDPRVPVQRVVPTLDGADSVRADGSTLRLLSWLDGLPLYRTAATRAQRESVAAGHARLVIALSGFTSEVPPPVLQWDIRHAAGLRERLDAVPADLRAQVEDALGRFDRHAAPQLVRLPRQYVHNDIQPYNVVVDERDHDRLTGILDFGDLVHTPVACDLGVAAAYHVLPGAHPLQSVGEYVAAFHAVRPLGDAEFEALPALIMARQVTTIVITSWRARTHPHNAAYILRNRPVVRSGLAQLLPVSQGEAVDYLRSACL